MTDATWHKEVKLTHIHFLYGCFTQHSIFGYNFVNNNI